MPSVSLILISRVIASASSMSQALRVVSANLYTGIWPKKTPADAQVRGLLYRPALPCSYLFTFVSWVPTSTRERSVRPVRCVQHAAWCLVSPTSIRAELLSFSHKDLSLRFPCDFVICQGSHLINACLLFVLIDRSLRLTYAHLIAMAYTTAPSFSTISKARYQV